MVGTAVLSIVFLSLPAAFTGIRKLNYETDAYVRSSMLVSSELEYLRTLEYSSINDMVGDGTTETEEYAGIEYTTMCEVSVGGAELDGMLEAVVSVAWSQHGRDRYVEGRAFFAEGGISDKSYEDAN